MKAVLTADIINSTKSSSTAWIDVLKKALKNFGTEGKDWEIYRGDEFQMLLKDSKMAFLTAITIKAALKITSFDAKIAIGLGDVDYLGEHIKESNGSAFIHSGRMLDELKNNRDQTLSIKSTQENLDENFNLIFLLLENTFEKWTESTATALLTFLENQDLNQNQIAEKLGISQSAFSQSLKRGNADAIISTDQYFRKIIAGIL